MKYKKVKEWKGDDLIGEWYAYYKIDGVRMLRDDDGRAVSRNGKPLYGCDDVPAEITDAEIYCGSWEASITATKTHKAQPVAPEHVYPLFPKTDKRLFIGTMFNPSKKLINQMMEEAITAGYEGLVLNRNDYYIKVKPILTFDVLIIGHKPGKGRNEGRLGSFVTEMGCVSGMTDEMRDNPPPIGTMIEVGCMELTKNGKFRHPRFFRIREDK